MQSCTESKEKQACNLRHSELDWRLQEAHYRDERMLKAKIVKLEKRMNIALRSTVRYVYNKAIYIFIQESGMQYSSYIEANSNESIPHPFPVT